MLPSRRLSGSATTTAATFSVVGFFPALVVHAEAKDGDALRLQRIALPQREIDRPIIFLARRLASHQPPITFEITK